MNRRMLMTPLSSAALWPALGRAQRAAMPLIGFLLQGAALGLDMPDKLLAIADEVIE
jgi:hypothetical protein